MNLYKKIKFREDIKDDIFFNTLKERVTGYLAENNYDGYATPFVFIKGAIYLTIYIGLYWLIIANTLPFPKILFVWAIMGILGILIGLNISHDAAHNSLFKSKRLNKIVYYLTFNLLGANAYLWQLRHVDSHHLFPNVDNCDADIDDNPFVRLSIYKKARSYQKYQWIYAPIVYLIYTLHWVFYKDFLILNKKHLANLRNIKHSIGEIFLFYVAKILYLFSFIGLPILLTSYSIGEVLVGFLMMHFFASYTFIFGLIASHFSDFTSFECVDKDGYLERSWAGHQIATSLDYHADKKWANFIFGGFNAHVAHHLFPTISHIHYPKISEFIAELSPDYGINYQNINWFEAVRSHFRFLKKLSYPVTPLTNSSSS